MVPVLSISQKSAKTQSGFSLIEVLLSVGIGALIVMGAVQVARDWAERVRLRDEASYLISVNEAAKSYVATNFGAIMEDAAGFNEGDITSGAALVNAGRAILIPVNNTGSGFYLKDGTIGLPANFSDISPLGRNVSIYVRNLGRVDGSLALQIITTTSVADASTARPMPLWATSDIAQAIGPEAGIFRAQEGCNSDIEGVFGNWAVSGSVLNGANVISGVNYCPPVDVNRNIAAYVVLQDRVTYASSVASSDYLYRMPIEGLPDANRMETDLNMNGNPISGVSALSVDNMVVEGNAQINGAGAAALYVDESLRVSGAASQIGGTRSNTGTNGGNLFVTNLEATSLSASNATLSTDGELTANGALTINGNLGVQGTLDTEGATFTAGKMVSGETILEGPSTIEALQVARAARINTLDAADVTTGRLNATGSMTLTNLQIIDDVAFNGTATFTKRVLADEFQFSTMQSCLSTIKYVYNETTKVYDKEQTDPYSCK